MTMPSTDALLRIAYTAAENGQFELALECYAKGAALGDCMCIHALGYMHYVGEGVPADKAMAMKLYRRAWRLGSHPSASNIATFYRDQGKMRTMFRWYKRLALAGDGSAQFEMARCYLAGVGVRKDIQSALRCLAAANASDYISESERNEARALLESLKPQIF